MHNQPNINPATGLPMVSEGVSGIDVGGNTYGFQNPWSCSGQQWDWEC